MKDIKKTYEEVKITAKEKEKIYNNIMNNRKKPFDFRIMFLVGTACLIVLGVFLFASPLNILQNKNGYNPIQNKKNRDFKLENSYKKEIITNVQNYLEANYIDISELNDGEELVIESKKIVVNHKYNACKGNLVIKRYNDSYSYNPEITCKGNDADDKEERKIIQYSGIFDQTFAVDDYVVVSSKVNQVLKSVQVYDIQNKEYIPSEMVFDNDLNITVFDKEGNVVLSKLIESKYQHEDSTMSVINVNKIDDYYFVALQVSHNRKINEYGGGTESIETYEIIFDKDGKDILYDKIVGSDGSRVSIDSTRNSYLGHDDKTIYYAGSNNNDRVIVKITEDMIETIKYDSMKENPNDGDSRLTLNSKYKDNFYGYGYVKTNDKYYAREIVKYDMNGQLLWSKTIVPEGHNIHKVVAENDKVYILSGYSDSVSENHKMLTVTDLDGEVIKSVNIESLVDGLNNSGNVDFYVDADKNIVVVISDLSNANKYFAVLDKDLNKIKTVDINESSSAYQFENTYLALSRLNGDKYTNVYSVDSNFYEIRSILIVISNVTENDIVNTVTEAIE